MTRMRLIIAAVLIVLVIAIGLKACHFVQPSPTVPKKAVTADDSALVVLKDGSVVVAPKGTVGRELMDWLANPDRKDRYFELGGHEFDGRSIEPTVESKVRVGRLIDMLKSNSGVSISIIGFTAATDNPVADLKLSQARATWLADALHDGGVSRSRLTVEGRGGADPIGNNTDPQGRARNERVALFLRSQPK